MLPKVVREGENGLFLRGVFVRLLPILWLRNKCSNRNCKSTKTNQWRRKEKKRKGKEKHVEVYVRRVPPYPFHWFWSKGGKQGRWVKVGGGGWSVEDITQVIDEHGNAPLGMPFCFLSRLVASSSDSAVMPALPITTQTPHPLSLVSKSRWKFFHREIS